MYRTLAIVIIVLAVIVIAYALFGQRLGGLRVVPPNELVSPTPVSSTSPAATDNPLLQGGSSYLDKSGIYSILYPNDYTLDTMEGGEAITRIYKKGATQKGQTEMYDGTIIVFETIQLKGKSLEEWVDQRISESTADGTLALTEEKRNVTYNGYPGFSYSVRGLGESTYFILQKDADSDFAVNITSSVADPQNVGFQKEVDTILSTLKILK